jgi:hypothetical protein
MLEEDLSRMERGGDRGEGESFGRKSTLFFTSVLVCALSPLAAVSLLLLDMLHASFPPRSALLDAVGRDRGSEDFFISSSSLPFPLFPSYLTLTLLSTLSAAQSPEQQNGLLRQPPRTPRPSQLLLHNHLASRTDVRAGKGHA